MDQNTTKTNLEDQAIEQTPVEEVTELSSTEVEENTAQHTALQSLATLDQAFGNTPSLDFSSVADAEEVVEEIPLEEEAEEVEQVTPSTSSQAPKTSKRKRLNHLTAKHGLRQFNDLQAGASVFLYDRINSLQSQRSRRAMLMRKIYTGEELSEAERKELEQLEQQIQDFEQGREQYSEAVEMDGEDMEECIEILEGILDAYQKTINPIWILVFILFMHLVSNLSLAYKHYQKHRL